MKILYNGEVSIFILAKLNINQKKVPPEENIYHQTDGQYKAFIIDITYNKYMAGYGTFQSGGTATMAMNKVSCRVLDSIYDPRGFGSLSSTLLRGGKQYLYTYYHCLMSLYKPKIGRIIYPKLEGYDILDTCLSKGSVLEKSRDRNLVVASQQRTNNFNGRLEQ